MRHVTEIDGKLTIPGMELMPGEVVAWEDLRVHVEISPHLQVVFSGPSGESRAPLTQVITHQHHYLTNEALRVAPKLRQHVQEAHSGKNPAHVIGVTMERVTRRFLNLAPLAPLGPLADPDVDGWPLIVQRESADQITLLCTEEMGPLIGIHLHQRPEGPEFHALRRELQPLELKVKLRPDWNNNEQLGAALAAFNHRTQAGWRRHNTLIAMAGLRALSGAWWTGRPGLRPIGEEQLACEAAGIPRTHQTVLRELELRGVPALYLEIAQGPALVTERSADIQDDLARLISSARGMSYHMTGQEWRDMMKQMEEMGLEPQQGPAGGIMPACIVPGSVPLSLPRPQSITPRFWPSAKSSLH